TTPSSVPNGHFNSPSSEAETGLKSICLVRSDQPSCLICNLHITGVPPAQLPVSRPPRLMFMRPVTQGGLALYSKDQRIWLYYGASRTWIPAPHEKQLFCMHTVRARVPYRVRHSRALAYSANNQAAVAGCADRKPHLRSPELKGRQFCFLG